MNQKAVRNTFEEIVEVIKANIFVNILLILFLLPYIRNRTETLVFLIAYHMHIYRSLSVGDCKFTRAWDFAFAEEPDAIILSVSHTMTNFTRTASPFNTIYIFFPSHWRLESVSICSIIHFLWIFIWFFQENVVWSCKFTIHPQNCLYVLWEVKFSCSLVMVFSQNNFHVRHNTLIDICVNGTKENRLSPDKDL